MTDLDTKPDQTPCTLYLWGYHVGSLHTRIVARNTLWIVPLSHREMEATLPGDVCATSWAADDVVALGVSGDESLVAVSSLVRVQVFLLHALSLGKREPLHSWHLQPGAALAQVI